MKEEEQKQLKIDREEAEQRAEQERQEMVRADHREQDRKEADRRADDEKYYQEKAKRASEEQDRREEQKRAEQKEQERHRHQEPKPNPIKEQHQKVEYFEHWQDVKGDKPTEINRDFIRLQYAHAIERAETPQELKEALAKSGIEMKRSKEDPRVYEYYYKDSKAESLSYMTDKKVYGNRPQEIKQEIKEAPKKQILER